MQDSEAILRTLILIRDQLEQRQHFYRGIALGLFYGIVGNILVSHYYKVFEGLILGEFSIVFWSNLIVLIVALIIVLVLSKKWYDLLKVEKTLLKSIREEIAKELNKLSKET